jgi:hypothetical protein
MSVTKHVCFIAGTYMFQSCHTTKYSCGIGLPRIARFRACTCCPGRWCCPCPSTYVLVQLLAFSHCAWWVAGAPWVGAGSWDLALHCCYARWDLQPPLVDGAQLPSGQVACGKPRPSRHQSGSTNKFTALQDAEFKVAESCCAGSHTSAHHFVAKQLVSLNCMC